MDSIAETISFVRSTFNSLPDDPFAKPRPYAAGIECTDEYQRRFLRAQTHFYQIPDSYRVRSDHDPAAVLDTKFGPGEVSALATLILSEKALEDVLVAAKKEPQTIRTDVCSK
ncbi:hypothetical protein F66182_4654 [Fusarium sp. NRRL 66182]|nr:hypothetical protein F66182_4654 [Fusarium sp. NRRL 66182]